MYDRLTTVTSVKLWMKITTNADDSVISQVIPRASELIGRHCNRDNLGAIESYSENYFPTRRMMSGRDWVLVLRHYPVVDLTSVVVSGNNVTLLTDDDLQAGAGGIFLEESAEPRRLRFRSIVVNDDSVIRVRYTAGYDKAAIPHGLQQACDQYVAEILRSTAFIALKSVAVQGETTALDLGGTWGMSKRVESMLVPYMNKIPFQMQ